MASAFIARKRATKEEDAARRDDLEVPGIGLLGVVVDDHGQGGILVERALGRPKDRAGRADHEQGSRFADGSR